MTTPKKALARQLARAERIAAQNPDDQVIAETCEGLRAEIATLDAGEVPEAHAEALAAITRQLLNVTERLAKMS